MAGEVHPVPFRTRKLSPLAPMVLRSESVGEQDVADQQGAFCVRGRLSFLSYILWRHALHAATFLYIDCSFRLRCLWIAGCFLFGLIDIESDPCLIDHFLTCSRVFRAMISSAHFLAPSPGTPPDLRPRAPGPPGCVQIVEPRPDGPKRRGGV